MTAPRVLFLHGLTKPLVDLVVSCSPAAFDTVSLERKTPLAEQIDAARAADFMMVYRAPLDPEVVRAASALKLVQLLAAGYDGMDLSVLSERGIPCANNGGANARAVADMTVLLMLGVYRRAVQTHLEMRAGQWGAGITGLNTFEMAGKKVGILGFGNIGQAVAKRVQGFEARVLYHNRRRLPVDRERALDVTYASLEDLLRDSDILSIHTPLTDQTQHLIGRAQLAAMKRSAVIVNTGRGAVIDEAALIEALRDGTIAGAGLDAFDPEPIAADNPLLTFDNVMLSPHTAGTTADTWERRGRFAYENFARVWSGAAPLSAIGQVSP
ncbi:2-hydroxyacid dehydrogenase [soil metagenome]